MATEQSNTNTELVKLQKLNKDLQDNINQLTAQVETLKSENNTKDQIIESLEKELESVLKLSSSNKTKQTLHQKAKPPQTNKAKPLSQNGHHEDTKQQDLDNEKKSRGHIGIVGATQIGTQLATLLSFKNYQIILVDQTKQQLEKSKFITKQICDSYLQQTLITKEQVDSSKNSIIYTNSMDDLKKYIDTMHIVIDTSHDVYKRVVLQNVVKCINNKCMIITHSNQKCITEITGYFTKIAPNKRENVIGVNLLWFELSLMNTKCIEIIPSWNTSHFVVEKCKALIINDLGKKCVIIQDQCGYISNRLMAVYINEAFDILERRIACNKDIDLIQASINGVNNNIAPFAMADKIGLDVVVQILDELYREYGLQKYVANSMLKQYVRSGKFGRKSGIGIYSYNMKKNANKKAVK